MSGVMPIAAITGDVSCIECFGDDNTSCTLCADGFVLTGNGFTCVAETAPKVDGNVSPTNCVTAIGTTPDIDYLVDESDNTCKSTIYSNDYPCPHGTY